MGIEDVILYLMADDKGISKPPLSPARLAANRRNAKKSTGPKTKAGKRRVALNPRRLGLAPPEFERQLQARGEDPRDFRRLHRDLAALLQPHDMAAEAAVQLLAMTWWEKARRIRNWVAAGPARTDDLDEKIEDLLRFLVYVQRQRHERWQAHLVEVLGSRLGKPADVRHKIERRLFAFGATKATRTYPRPLKVDGLLEEFQATFGDILAGIRRKAATGPEPKPAGGAGEGVVSCEA
jgi:hypothetical protein